MTTIRILPAILIFLCQLLATVASYAAGEDGVAAAKKEGEVVLYLSTNLTDANGMIQLFKQKYPFINVNAFRADNENS